MQTTAFHTRNQWTERLLPILRLPCLFLATALELHAPSLLRAMLVAEGGNELALNAAAVADTVVDRVLFEQYDDTSCSPTTVPSSTARPRRERPGSCDTTHSTGITPGWESPMPVERLSPPPTRALRWARRQSIAQLSMRCGDQELLALNRCPLLSRHWPSSGGTDRTLRRPGRTSLCRICTHREKSGHEVLASLNAGDSVKQMPGVVWALLRMNRTYSTSIMTMTPTAARSQTTWISSSR